MYDSVDFKYRNYDAGGNFLSETPKYIEVTGNHIFGDMEVITGNVDGLKISVNRNGVNAGKASLCKWYHGDNFSTLTRIDTRRAIEKLSDILHIPMHDATISRVDVAHNFTMNHPTNVYFNHLGSFYPNKRLEQPDGIYYVNKKNNSIFYDKIKEQKIKGGTIPELYIGKNVLRYEMQFKTRLKDTFKVERVTASMLYDEQFYSEIVNKWHVNYKSIKKINDISINFEVMRTKKEFDLVARLCFIQQQGGELAMLKQIAEAQKKGELTRRQADELKAATRAACALNEDITKSSDVIQELDKKISRAVTFCK